ncbi:MAG: DNA repair protein RecN [Acidobacteriota bacterium]|nr:MAG: DNA repair protein RecN [Acidobacteriota bacterium]
MLKFLNIVNFAVIDELQVDFRPGLNVLSGETGSGKSIIIDALGLLLGERGSADMIRTGAERAFVEGIFETGGNRPLVNLLQESGIDAQEDELVIRRELGQTGRGRIFVNGRTSSTALLKSIQPHVIDIHGQGDQQSLLSPEAHLNLLDAYAGADRQALQAAFERLTDAIRRIEAIRQSESERLQTLDILEYQISEIEQATLQPDEDVSLQEERNLLANAEKLASLCGEAYDILYDDENSVQSQIAAVGRRLGDLAELDPKASQQLEQLAAVRVAIDDMAYFLRDYLDGVQASPERLKFVEDRLAEIDRLKRKYGKSVEELLEMVEDLRSRREGLERSEEQARELTDQLGELLEAYLKEARALGDGRRAAARKFEKAIAKEFADVALEAARFSVSFLEPPRSQWADRLEAIGGPPSQVIRRASLDQIEFHFSANPGEDLKPISSVASGGELSRLMLVLKTITAPSQFPRTLIFDEIDAGIGGKVADAVGQRLKRLARSNQVLCVTHQSNIARYADAHFHVSKEFAGGRTLTRVTQLDGDGRVDELARMIAGAEVTPLARKHARELLKK